MKTGFIFDHSLCVACNACSAACLLEHGWLTHPRKIITYNRDAAVKAPVFSISMACNHCDDAPCLSGCPASAIRRTETGAVLIDKKKCLGCKLCSWYCPYEAPAFNNNDKVMEKCTLCYSDSEPDKTPVCANACPTGALNFGAIDTDKNLTAAGWFPDPDHGPSIKFVTEPLSEALRIIPSRGNEYIKQASSAYKPVGNELSLVLFSFLSVLSVSWLVTSFLTASYPPAIQFIGLLPIIALISFLHLGKKLRAWRALANIAGSPLSREILFFLLFSAASSAAVLLKIPALIVSASILGLIFLVTIDLIYLKADTEINVKLHSGQTLLTGLLIISYFSKLTAPFAFVAAIKAVLILSSIIRNNRSKEYSASVFVRLFMLLLPAYSFFTKRADSDIIISLLFLCGEFIDRILFYTDFNPSGISLKMEKHFKRKYNERQED